MHLYIIALASSDWGIARFTTDSFALNALGEFNILPNRLVKDKVGFKNICKSGNFVSNR